MSKSGKFRRELAVSQYEEAKALAESKGAELLKHTEAHYQLRKDGWIINLYPGNQRIYADPNQGMKAPYLHVLVEPWGLLDIVRVL